jgi:hypothetical protein
MRTCLLTLTVPLAVLVVSMSSAQATLTIEEENQLNAWLGADYIYTTVWHGDKASSTSSQFHASVDHVGPTVSVFDVEWDDGSHARIGGYTQESWGGEGFKYDPSAFIFINLTIDLKLSIDPGEEDEAIYTHPNYFPTFGTGYDLWGGSEILGEGSSLGSTYNGISPEDELPNNMLADLFLAQSLNAIRFRKKLHQT